MLFPVSMFIISARFLNLNLICKTSDHDFSMITSSINNNEKVFMESCYEGSDHSRLSSPT